MIALQLHLKTKLIKRLRRLSKDMLDIGAEMEFIGASDVAYVHKSRELINGARIVRNWALELGPDDPK